ncbi:MAG TPA: hypothetical protein VGM52_08545 [Herbaspirillum sp.]
MIFPVSHGAKPAYFQLIGRGGKNLREKQARLRKYFRESSLFLAGNISCGNFLANPDGRRDFRLRREARNVASLFFFEEMWFDLGKTGCLLSANSHQASIQMEESE